MNTQITLNDIKDEVTKEELLEIIGLGVKKNIKGGKNGAGVQNSLVTVWDMVANGYRMINLSTLTALKVGGVTYEVI
jgi:hypothetical protein